MDCTDCGACCIGTRIELHYLEWNTMPKDQWVREGNKYYLKSVDGHCILFDMNKRLCKDYGNRPETCRRFERGGELCRFVRAREGIPTIGEAA